MDLPHQQGGPAPFRWLAHRFAAGDRPVAAGDLLAAWRILFAAACLVRISDWQQLVPEMQVRCLACTWRSRWLQSWLAVRARHIPRERHAAAQQNPLGLTQRPTAQESYLLVPAPGWGWLPLPPPDVAALACAAAALCALALSAGLLAWLASPLLLALCCYLAAMDQDPGSQLDSLMLQLGFVNCLLPLGR